MRAARVRSKEWAYKLYVMPESWPEAVALWLRGYRRCGNVIFSDKLMCHPKHKNNTDLLR